MLRVFVPPALVLAGVLLIRSAHVHSEEMASEQDEAPADSNNADSNKPQGRKESPSRAVQAIGALLAVFVVAGMLDLAVSPCKPIYTLASEVRCAAEPKP